MLLLDHNPLHNVIQYEHMALWLWTAFFTGQEMWKSHGNKSGLYTDSWSNSCCMVQSCGLHRNGHCCETGWCYPWFYNEVFLDRGTQLLNRLTVCLHWLCHYMTLSPGTGGPRCPSGLLKMESSPGMTSLSCVMMSSVWTDQPVKCTVLHKGLLVCLLSTMCLCAIYTITATL